RSWFVVEGLLVTERLLASFLQVASVVCEPRLADRLSEQVADSVPLYVLAREASIVELIKTTRDKFGRLDILINNARITHSARLDETRTEDLDRCWTINARA
ncbi:MAG: SDR family NAD(P)-dependent oxidoreductase, partial [Planctomycetaceae bacterium]